MAMEFSSGFHHKVKLDPETSLRSAIADAQEKGFEIGAGDFGVKIVKGFYRAKGETLCPIGALLVDRPTKQKEVSSKNCFEDAAMFLGVPAQWIEIFLDGYELYDDKCGLFDNAWELGNEFRIQFLLQDYVYN